MAPSFEQLEARVRSGPAGRSVVVEPHAREAVEAVVREVVERGASAHLIGDPDRIQMQLDALGGAPAGVEVVPASSAEAAVAAAVDLIRGGMADFVVKGSIPSATLLRGLLGRDRLGAGRVASHLYVIEAPAYRNRVVAITDAGVNIRPDLATKADIIRNSVEALDILGIDNPRVAVLSAVELVKAEIPSGGDAALLNVMGARGQLGRLAIDGPLSIDAALLPAAARDKALGGPVAGQADLLVTPDIDAANMTSKALIGEMGRAMGVVLGAQVPVALPSRGDSLATRQLSLALASYLASEQASRVLSLSPVDA